MANDPIQGLIDYVLDVKPYHTKIVEVAVGYSQNEPVDLTITEDFQVEVDLCIPADVEGSPAIPVQVCGQGFGAFWDRPSPFVVVDSVQGAFPTGTISLQGDQTLAFTVGAVFEIRDPVTAGSPLTPVSPTLTYTVSAVTYDALNDVTVITPTVAVGPEFFTSIPAGSFSRGDVFIVYDVAATATGTNVITVNATSPDEFRYGRTFELRNGSPELLNQQYNILTIGAQTPTTIEVITTGPVPIDTTGTSEFVFAANGFDSLDLCSDIPEGLGQTFINENLIFQWNVGSPSISGSPLSFNEDFFQYFVLAANPGTNQFEVEGNVDVGSPGTVCLYSSVEPGLTTLNANNGNYTVTGRTYNAGTNRTTFTVSPGFVDPFPTGWLIPGPCPAAGSPPAGSPPAGSPPAGFVMAFTDSSSESGLALGVQYTSDSDITMWPGITPQLGGSPLNVAFPSPAGLRYAPAIDTWALAYRRGSSNESMWYSTDDGTTWQPGVESFTTATGAQDKLLDWSPTLGLFACGGNSGQIATSPDGITWTNQNPGIFGFSQVLSIHWSPGLSIFLASGSGNEVGWSADGSTWNLVPVEPGPPSSDDLVAIYSVGTRVFVSNENDEDVYYTDNVTDPAPVWTQSVIPQPPPSGGGSFAATSDGSIIVWAGQGFNDGEYIWRSTDNGVSFDRIEVATQLGFPVIDTFCVIYDQAYGFVIGGEFREGSPRAPVIGTSPDALTWTVRVNSKFLHPDGFASNEVQLLGSKNQV